MLHIVRTTGGKASTERCETYTHIFRTFVLSLPYNFRNLSAMKEERFELRMEPSLKRHLISAAAYDHKTLAGLMVHAAIQYAEGLRARGWRAKDAPIPRDGRRKTEAAA